MRTVFRYDGLRFFFYSNDGDPRAPVHVHVMKAGAEAKFWLESVSVARSDGLDAKTLRELARVLAERRDEIERAWHEHFG